MKMKLYHNLIAILSLLAVQNADAQTGFFSPANANARTVRTDVKKIARLSHYHLKTSELRSYLLSAPLEFKSKSAQGLVLEIPLPNGTSEIFALFESPILAPEVAAKHPEIKTYAGKGTTHKEYSVRINLTSTGFNAIILGVENDAVYFEKTNTDHGDNTYRSYFSRDAISPKSDSAKTSGNRCGTIDGESHAVPPKTDGKNKRGTAVAETGTTLRTFRLAMAADAEFTANKGGTAALAYNALTNYVNNMNAVYRKELSVSFVLVSDESIVYTNSSTDPYTNSDQILMLDENRANLDLKFGTNGYDIGHVLGYEGSSGGGVAARGSVCDPSSKGRGTSGVGDGSYADVFDQQLIQHEIGHQFDMSHSYNSNVPVCTTRAYDTSVEPGSGTTIMSYGYTCNNDDAGTGLVGNDDYEAGYTPILNFHAVSYDQANAFIETISCYTSTATGNTVPVINAMQSSWTIPKSTPFVLNGAATDADASDVLSYSWEGTNISDETDKAALTDATLSDRSRPPFFRTYAPVSTTASSQPGTRYYPRLTSILDGSNYAVGDKLPSVGVITTHKLTVRDNDSGVSSAAVTVNVNGSSGPFLITNDIPGSLLGPIGSYPLGGTMNVNWSVNGTAGAPVNCTLVDIFLSTDGGLSFPTTLATAISNNGTAVVTLPLINTNKARIKIAPSASTTLGNTPNIFFDISNADFTIGSPMPVTLISFNAKIVAENMAMLTWETSSETNNKGFEIEMSLDSRKFIQVGVVDGSGNSKSERRYQYTISDLSTGTYYFRLKQIDYDGKFEYSRIRSIKLENPKDILAVYPNPTVGTLRLQALPTINNEAFSIEIIDGSGRSVISLPSGKNYAKDYELDTASLSPGLYIMTVRGTGFARSVKFVKQ